MKYKEMLMVALSCVVSMHNSFVIMLTLEGIIRGPIGNEHSRCTY